MSESQKPDNSDAATPSDDATETAAVTPHPEPVGNYEPTQFNPAGVPPLVEPEPSSAAPAGFDPSATPAPQGPPPAAQQQFAPPQFAQQQFAPPQYGAPGQYVPPQQQQWGAPQQPYGQPGVPQYGQPQQAMYAPPQTAPLTEGQPFGTNPQGQYPPTSAGFEQQQQGQFGAPSADPFGAMAQPSPKKSGRLYYIGAGILAALAAIVLLTAFVFPGWAPKTLSADSAQTGVERVLTQDYKSTNVSNAQCPSGQRVKEGSSFTCTVKVGDRQRSVTITFLDGKGNYEVSRPS